MIMGTQKETQSPHLFSSNRIVTILNSQVYIPTLIHYMHVHYLTCSITDDDFNSTPSFYAWEFC